MSQAKHTSGRPWKSSWNGAWQIQTSGGWLIAHIARPKSVSSNTFTR